MHWKDTFEFTFYMVDTFALPFAIIVYVIERRKERQADEEELYQRLSDEYLTFLKLVLDNSDLQLLHKSGPPRPLTDQQIERRHAIFGILVLDLRARLYPRVRAPDAEANPASLVLVGGLHAGMVSQRRLPRGPPRVTRRRGPGFPGPY